jgi:2-amino-4-hydroxy-6-hydroxymethyldihydropteridine diphosphokinase
MTPARLEHVGRVAELMGAWAEARDLSPLDVSRWRAAGVLHDALRDEDPASLRVRVAPRLRELPAPVLHGPAAAERLRAEGVRDEPLLKAVAYHTLGHARFDDLGFALYAADFLEPGRDLLNAWREELRGRMPDEAMVVVQEILAARIGHLVTSGRPVRPETMAFWNSLTGEG